MSICYIEPDGTHVRGCDQHLGEHPYDWCRERPKKPVPALETTDVPLYSTTALLPRKEA